MSTLSEFISTLIGPDGKPNDLTFFQISLRSLLIFVSGLAMVRVGDRRSLAEKTAFDAVFIVLLGSMLSRAMNGTAPFFMTIASGGVLVLIHRICAMVACRSHTFGKIIKGREVVLVQNGEPNREEMRRSMISEHDLAEDLRLDLQVEELKDIALARLERSGDISFVRKKSS